MMRSVFVVITLVLLPGCFFKPPGTCVSTEDCFSGGFCQAGICLSGCADDSHCGDWQQCNVEARRCVTREGFCSTTTECPAAHECNSSHVCELSQSACVDSSQCQSYETCNAQNLCEPQEGRCTTVANCGGLWASCDETNTCQNTPSGGNDIIIWGTLSEGACYRDALAPLGNPSNASVGFDCYASSIFRHVMRSDGSVIYDLSRNSKNVLYAFRPDRMVWKDNQWEYPSATEGNDTVIPTPACDDRGQFSLRYVPQEGSGAILYSCGAGWYRTGGGQVFTTNLNVYAWNSAGLFLISESFETKVADTQGNVVKVTGLPWGYSVIDARAHGTTFWIAVSSSSSTPSELYEVGGDGVATKRGEYAAHLNGGHGGSGVLDRSGALYTKAYVGPDDIVYRRTPDGATATVVYTEADKPAKANDFSERNLKLYVLFHASELVRGP